VIFLFSVIFRTIAYGNTQMKSRNLENYTKNDCKLRESFLQFA
jgi:hypothetical protein